MQCRPLEKFRTPGKSEELVKLRYEKSEKKRKALIERLKQIRERLINNANCYQESKALGQQDFSSASAFDTEKSKLFFENVVSDMNQELFHKTVRKTKDLEVNVMAKLLQEEEIKTATFQEHLIENEVEEEKKERKREKKTSKIESKRRYES